MGDTFAIVRRGIAALETVQEEPRAKIASDADQALNALNGRIDVMNKDLATMQDSLRAMQHSLLRLHQ